MGMVVSFEEVMEMLEEGLDPETRLRAVWDAAIDSAAWIVHETNPRTYPGREHEFEADAVTDHVFTVLDENVRSLGEIDRVNLDIAAEVYGLPDACHRCEGHKIIPGISTMTVGPIVRMVPCPRCGGKGVE